MKLDVEKAPTQTIVRCAGRITSSTSELLKSTVRPLIPDTPRIVIDLTNVSFLDSSGLGAIVGFWVSAKRAKHELKLANASQRIMDLFLMSNLAPIFEGHNDYLGVTPDQLISRAAAWALAALIGSRHSITLDGFRSAASRSAGLILQDRQLRLYQLGSSRLVGVTTNL